MKASIRKLTIFLAVMLAFSALAGSAAASVPSQHGNFQSNYADVYQNSGSSGGHGGWGGPAMRSSNGQHSSGSNTQISNVQQNNQNGYGDNTNNQNFQAGSNWNGQQGATYYPWFVN